KWIARLGVIISFGMGLLLFKINGLSHINYLWENLFGFYWNMEFFFKIIILLFPLIIIEIYQIKTKDEDFKLITKRNPIILFILAIIYIQFFLLFGAEESKEFFYFQF
ncbi:MAG: MBOAT family protein, partial [Leptospiraceae bacterium]|nr:MBOAT family protein [Leptospiraceae bacterium]